jgi:Tfp pilus assembly protein PilN
VLDAKNPRIYDVNLLPSSVREGQRVFKLAWHGYVLLALLFLSTLFFTWQVRVKSDEISKQRDLLERKQTQVAENQTLTTSIQSLQEELGRYHTSLALYDTLVPGSDRWSKVFTQLSHGVEDLNSIWLTDFSTQTTGVLSMNGFAVYRTRIPRLSTLFDNSLLREVAVQEIRDQVVYRYVIDVPAPLPGQ